MSLIQEALRRKDEDLRAALPRGEGLPPRSSPPASPPATPKRRPARRVGLIVTLLLLLAAAGILFLYRYHPETLNRLTARFAPPGGKETVTEMPVEPAGKSLALEVAGEGPEDPLGQTSSAETAPAEPLASSPPESGTLPATLTRMLRSSIQLMLSKGKETPAATPDAAISWPSLRLTGTLIDPRGIRTAILNGELVTSGEQIGEVTVAEIRPDGAWLEFRGERRFLSVGRTLR